MEWEHVEDVFLDMDGTLLDLNFDNYFWHEHVPLRYSEKYNIEFDQAKHQLRSQYDNKKGTLEWYCLDYWTKQLDLDITSLKQEIVHRVKIFPNVKYFLLQLKKLDKKISLVTNAHHDSVQIKLKYLNLEDYFDTIISSHDFGYPKEKTLFWNKLKESNPFNPSKTLFIDDNLSVLAAAEEFGINYLLTIKQPDSLKPQQDTLHYSAISNFAEIMPCE